jgi:hypothetical protein
MIELPVFRDASGVMRTAVTLPEDLRGRKRDIVLDALVERGLAVKRFRFRSPLALLESNATSCPDPYLQVVPPKRISALRMTEL